MVRRHTRRAYLAAMGASAVAIGGAEPVAAQSETVVVPDDQPTIQAGVDAVASGGTVEVRPDTYTEQVNVGKPVTIVGDPGDGSPGAGADAPVLDGEGKARRVGFKLWKDGVSPDDVTVRGFEIRNYGSNPDGEWGKGVSAGEDNVQIAVEDCTVHDIAGAGVSVSTWGDRSYSDWTVRRCRFANSAIAGVRFDHVSDATVSNNEFVAGDDFQTFPRIGVYLHANTRDGESGIQQNVLIENNSFTGDSRRAAIWLLAINKNDPSLDTLAELRDVTVTANEFTNMPDTEAIATGVNPMQGAPTRMRNVIIDGNIVWNARAGISINSGASDGLAGVLVENNDVEARRRGLSVNGVVPGAIADVTSRENRFVSDGIGVNLGMHTRDWPKDSNRFAVGSMKSVSDEITASDDRPAVAVVSNHRYGAKSVVIEDVTASGRAGIHASGRGANALDSITLSGGSFEGINGPGVHISGNTEGAIGTAELTDVKASGVHPGLAVTANASHGVEQVDVTGGTFTGGGPGVMIRGQGETSVSDVSLTGMTVDAEGPGVMLRGAGGAPDAPSIGRATVKGVTVQQGAGVGVFGWGPDGVGSVSIREVVASGRSGVRISGHSPGAIHDVTVDGLTVDAAGGPGVMVAGDHDATATGDRPCVGPVDVSNADLSVGAEAGFIVSGEAPGALTDIAVSNLTIDSTRADKFGVGIFVRGLAPDATGKVTVDGADLTTREHGILVHPERSPDVGLSLSATDVTVDSADGSGVVVASDTSGGVDDVDVTRLQVEHAKRNGVLFHGGAPSAIGDATVSDLTVRKTAGPGVQVVGEHPDQQGGAPAVSSVDVDTFDLTTVDNPDTDQGSDGIVVRGQDQGTVGPVSLRNGSIDAHFIGVSAAAERAGTVEALAVEQVDVTSGAGGVEIAAHDDATFETASLGELVLQTAWAGVQVHGREGGSVETVSATGLDVESDGPGVLVNGKSPAAVGTMSFTDVDVDSTKKGVVVSGEAPDAIGEVAFADVRLRADDVISNVVRSETGGGVGSVSFKRADIRDSLVGLFLWGPVGDAVESVDVRESEVRDNEYGIVVVGNLLGDALRVRQTNFVSNEKPPESEFVGYGLANFSAAGGTVDARRNYWGHPSGPTRPRPGKGPSQRTGPSEKGDAFEKRRAPPDTIGQGDRITEGVAYRPWLSQPA